MVFFEVLLLLNIKFAHSITCISYSGSTSSSVRVTTNVTGPGTACCAVKAWAGPFFGVEYKPYNYATEMCCKDNSYFIGNVQYQFSTIGIGNTCCNGLAYDNNTGMCCSEYNINSQTYANNVGPGDTCCGTKPYYKNKQACCSSYISAIKLTVYSVADQCCRFGQSPINKTYQVCCNDWNPGNGDSCCNNNGEENGNEPPDVPYYSNEKCCVSGKLNNYPCIQKTINRASSFYLDRLNSFHFYFIIILSFKLFFLK